MINPNDLIPIPTILQMENHGKPVELFRHFLEHPSWALAPAGCRHSGWKSSKRYPKRCDTFGTSIEKGYLWRIYEAIYCGIWDMGVECSMDLNGKKARYTTSNVVVAILLRWFPKMVEYGFLIHHPPCFKHESWPSTVGGPPNREGQLCGGCPWNWPWKIFETYSPGNIALSFCNFWNLHGFLGLKVEQQLYLFGIHHL